MRTFGPNCSGRPLFSLFSTEKPLSPFKDLTNFSNVLNCDSSIIHIFTMDVPAEIDPDFERQKSQELAKLPINDIFLAFFYRLEPPNEQWIGTDSLSQYSVKDLLDAIRIQLEPGLVEAEEIKSHFGLLFARHHEKLRPFEKEIEAIMAMNIVPAEPAPTEVVEKPDSKKKPWYKRRGLVLGAALTALTAADYGRQLNDTDFDQRIAFETQLAIIKLIQSDKITPDEDYECQQRAERSLWLTAYHPFDAAVILPYYLAHKIDGKSHNLFPLSQIAYPREKKLFYERTKAEWACDQATIKKNAEAIKPEK